MNPQDDPEARIRALEPTELGAEQPSSSAYDGAPHLPPPIAHWDGQSPYEQSAYGQPTYDQSPYGQSPYGQPTYGQSPYGGYGGDPYPMPYSGTPQRSGFRPWMVIVPLVIVFLLITGGAVAMVLSTLSSQTSPVISENDGDLIEVPTVPDLPQIPELPDLPPIVVDPGAPNAPPDAVVEAGGTITVTGIGSDRTVLCNDNILIISGANNTVAVTGHCTAVTVSGFENVVTAESTGEITVSGFENRVTYRTGSPVISQSGSGNTIEQG